MAPVNDDDFASVIWWEKNHLFGDPFSTSLQLSKLANHFFSLSSRNRSYFYLKTWLSTPFSICLAHACSQSPLLNANDNNSAAFLFIFFWVFCFENFHWSMKSWLFMIYFGLTEGFSSQWISSTTSSPFTFLMIVLANKYYLTTGAMAFNVVSVVTCLLKYLLMQRMIRWSTVVIVVCEMRVVFCAMVTV